MPGGSTTGAPDWRDAAKLRKFLADDIPQWTPSEGAENTRAFLAALREKCSTEIGAMTGLLLALFEERVDASKAGYELAQKLKRGGGGATPREELDMEMLFGDTPHLPIGWPWCELFLVCALFRPMNFRREKTCRPPGLVLGACGCTWT